MGRSLGFCFLIPTIIAVITGPTWTLAQVLFSSGFAGNLFDTSIDIPITYNVHNVNVGGAFDGTTFVAPVQGQYLFTFCGRSYWFTIHLKVNGDIRRSAQFYEVTHDDNDNLVSNSVILKLNANDQVAMYLDDISYGLINPTNPLDGIFTSFSGVLLNANSDQFAFSAALSLTLPDVMVDQPIEFDHIDTNNGNAFNGTVFTAQSAGLYMFTFAGRGDFAAVHLKVNGNTKRSAMIQDGHSYEDNCFSNFMMLILNANDRVTVHHGEFGDRLINLPINGVNGVFTEFSGVLLYTDTTGVYAFSGTRKVRMDDVSSDTIIDFEVTDCNLGLAFDGSMFTAPVNGYYLFTFSALSIEVMVHLKVDGVIKSSAIRDDAHYFDQMTSNSVILQLTAGQEVGLYLNPFGVYGIGNAGTSNGIATHFAGVLLSGV